MSKLTEAIDKSKKESKSSPSSPSLLKQAINVTKAGGTINGPVVAKPAISKNAFLPQRNTILLNKLANEERYRQNTPVMSQAADMLARRGSQAMAASPAATKPYMDQAAAARNKADSRLRALEAGGRINGDEVNSLVRQSMDAHAAKKEVAALQAAAAQQRQQREQQRIMGLDRDQVEQDFLKKNNAYYQAQADRARYQNGWDLLLGGGSVLENTAKQRDAIRRVAPNAKDELDKAEADWINVQNRDWSAAREDDRARLEVGAKALGEGNIDYASVKDQDQVRAANFIRHMDDPTYASGATTAKGAWDATKMRTLTADEKRVLRKYAANGMWSEAVEYLNILERDMNARQTTTNNAQIASGIKAMPAAVGTLATAPLSYATGLANVGGMTQSLKNLATGEYEPIDTNSFWMAGANASATANQANVEDWNEFTHKYLGMDSTKATQMVQSMVQNMARYPLGPASLTFMAIGASGSAVLENAQKGMSPGQAMTLAVASGFAEYITEQVSLESFLDIIKNANGAHIIPDIIRQFLSEGSEEMASDYINLLADGLVRGANSDMMQYRDDLLAQGYEKHQADALALIKYAVTDPAESGLIGGITGMAMGGGGNIIGQGLNAMENAKFDHDTTRNIGSVDRVMEAVEMGQMPDAKTVRQALAAIDLDEAVRDQIWSEQEHAEGAEGPDSLRKQLGISKYGEATEEVRMQELVDRSRERKQRSDMTPALMLHDKNNLERSLSKLGEDVKKAALAGYQPGTDNSKYYSQVVGVYNAAMTGKDLASVQTLLPAPVAQAIYDAGVRTQEANLKAAREAAASVKAYHGDENGHYVEQNDTFKQLVKDKKISREQVKGLEFLGKVTQTRIVIVGDDIAGGKGNGSIDPGKGVIHITASNLTQSYLSTASHEVTHRMQEVAPDAYKQYRDMVLDKLMQDGSIERVMSGTDELYRSAGQDLSYDETADEVVANYTADLLRDTSSFYEIMQQDKTVAQKIYEAVKAFVSKVANGIRGDKELQRVFGQDHDDLEKIVKAWGDALKETSERAKGLESSKNAAQEGGERFALKDYGTDRMAWTVENDVLTKKEQGAFWTAIADLSKRGYNVPRTWYGGYIVDVGSKLVFTDGDFKNPSISTVIEFDDEYEDTMAKPKEMIFNAAKRSKAGYREALRNVSEIFGSWYVTEHDPQLYEENGRKTGRGKGTDRGGNHSGAEQGVKFALKSPVEETRNLIALHNLTDRNLLDALRLGGLPSPSIAIVKAEAGHSKYGPISLLFDKTSIDPQSDRRNKVYGSDAWTPTAPQVEYQANEAAEERLDAKYYELARKVGYDKARPMYRFANELEDTLNRRGGEAGIIDELKDDTGMMQLYLADTGKGMVEDVQKTTTYTMPAGQVEQSQFIIDAIGADEFEALRRGYPLARWMKEHAKALEQAMRGFYSSIGFDDQLIDSIIEDTAAYKNTSREVARAAKSYYLHGSEYSTTEYDGDATRQAIRDKVDKSGYEAWLNGLFSGLEGEKGIYNGRDPFTASGNRRSWKQLHNAYTLENIVKAMTELQADRGQGSWGVSAGTLAAMATPAYKTINEIKADSGRLSMMSEQDYEASLKEIDAEISDILAEVRKKGHSGDSFSELDAISETMKEAAAGSKTIDSIMKAFAETGYKIGTPLAQRIQALYKTVATMPTGYFEAKPQRAVGFDEVKAAIIPSDSSEALRKGLADAGVRTIEYTAGDEADRLRAVNSVENVRFSLRTERDQEYAAAVEAGNRRTQKRLVAEAAKEAGYTTEKLYHGTARFGFTEFRPGVIFTTPDQSIAAGYGTKEYARPRQVAAQYVEDDGTNKTLFRNAKTILDQTYREITDADVERTKEDFRARSADLAERVNDAWVYVPDTLPDAPQSILDGLDYVLVLAGDTNEYLDDIFRHEDYRESLTYDLDKFDENYEKVREYFVEHRDQIKGTALEPMYNLILGHDLFDFAVETRYKLLRAAQRNGFILSDTGRYVETEAVRDQVEFVKKVGAYELYGRPGNNPLEIDAKGAFWTNIPAFDGTYSTDQIVSMAKERGYTSVHIKNVMDPAGNNFTTNKAGDEYIFFDSSDVKSADPVTFDDQGNVIPLSERFNSEKKDIRYSLRGATEYQGRVLLNESTVDQYLRDYAAKGSPKYAQAYIAYMRPSDFLDLTTTNRAAIKAQSRELDEAELGDASRSQPIQLYINHETGEVEGHEGRHRMQAMLDAGIQRVPVLLFDSSNKNSKAAIDMLRLRGQDFGATRSEARVTVHDLLPMSYENRDEIVSRFSKQSTGERAREATDRGKNLRYSLRLTDEDLTDYLRAGGRRNISKQAALDAGEKIILTSEEEIEDYIRAAVHGETSGTTVAYGKVNKALADDIRTYSKGKITVDGDYLELVPGDLKHAFDGHSEAKQAGDVPLSMADFEHIPEYIDQYDDLIYAIRYKSGRTHVCVGKKIASGKIVIIETVSQSRGALLFKNAIGVSDEKYQTDYLDKYKRDTLNAGGSESSNTSPRDSSASIGTSSVAQTDQGVKYSLRGGDAISRQVRELQKENQQLKDRLEYWRSQTKRRTPGMVNKQSVTQYARELIKSYGAELDASEISDALLALYNEMGTTKGMEMGGTGAAAQTIDDQARAIAQTIVENALEQDTTLYDQYKDLRDYLRKTRLVVGSEVQGDIADYGEWRKSQMGRLNLGSGQTNIDQVYGEMEAMWPEFFDSSRETTPSDMLTHIADIADQLYTIEEFNPFSYDMQNAVDSVANGILDKFFEIPEVKKTFADKAAERLDETKRQGKEALARERAKSKEQLQLDRQIAQADKDAAVLAERMAGGRELERLRQRNQQRTQEALAKVRAQRDERIQTLKENYRAKDAKGRESRNAKELRAKIIRHSSALSQKLLRPNDKQHIPQELRTTVARVLDSINLESAYTVDPETGKRVKNNSGDPTKRSLAFLDLRKQYADLLSKENGVNMVVDPALLGGEGVTGLLDQVGEMRDVKLADMNTEQLNTIWKAVRAIEHSLTTYNRVLSASKFERTQDWAEAIRRDTASRRDWRGVMRKPDFSKKGAGTNVGLSFENPYTFFSHLGDSGKEIYRVLRNAQDHQQVMIDQLVSEFKQVVTAKEITAWDNEVHEFTTERDERLVLTTSQIMELHELMKREQAIDHLMQGGVVQPAIPSKRITRNSNSAIQLTETDLREITGKLTKRQIQVADAMQKIMNTTLAGWGNEAAMQAYGYEKFTGKDYWPIRSAGEALKSETEKGKDIPRSIKNISLAKQVVPGANNRVDIQSAFETFKTHSGDMIDYAAWLVPIEDVNHLFNYEFREDGRATGTSIKGIMDRVIGIGSQKYMRQLLDDIQNGIGGINDDFVTGIVSKTIGAFKGAAVGANIRVVLQQPTAWMRAAVVLNPDSMGKGLVAGVNGKNAVQAWKVAQQWSPIAARKEMGGFDMSPGLMDDVLLDQKNIVQKVNDKLSKPAGAADAVTWGALWNACEWQTKQQNPGLDTKSDAFMEATADLFAEVIDQSQVVDGVMQRSHIMRSSNEITKMATSFMGEPIMTLNMLMRSWDQFRWETDGRKRSAAMRMMGRTTIAFVLNAALNAFAQSVVDGLRDDDGDKKYWERLVKAMLGDLDDGKGFGYNWKEFWGGNLGDGLNLLNNVPYVKDVLSMMDGYEVKRTDMQVISDIVKSGQNVVKAFGEGKQTRAYAMKQLTVAVAKLFGIPAANLSRDLWAGARSFAYESKNVQMQYDMEKAIYKVTEDKNASKFYPILYRALKKSPEDYKKLRDQLMKDMNQNGKAIDAAVLNLYTKALEKNPKEADALTDEAKAIIGARIKPEKKTSDTFGADDLTRAQYNAYSDQSSRDYLRATREIPNIPELRGMDEETQAKVYDAAWKLAHDKALVDNAAGQYTPSAKWLQNAEAVEAAGVTDAEYALFYAAYQMFESTKDADGNTVKGQSKKDKVRDWLEDYDVVTDPQRRALWEAVYDSKW